MNYSPARIADKDCKGEDCVPEKPWAQIAARNAMGIIHDLQERGSLGPVLRVDDIAGRIRQTFHDRNEYNAAVMETDLPGEVKMFLLVPEP